MAVRFFGQWLVERGLVRPDQLLTALDLQKATNRELHVFGVEARIITQKQADEIAQEQQRTDRRFGEIVKEMGLLTEEQIQRLSRRQSGARMFIGEILVQQGLLPFQEAADELAAFHESIAPVEAEKFFALENLPERDYFNAYLESCINIFQRVGHRPLRLSATEPKLIPPQDHTVMQIIDSSKGSYVALSMPSEELRRIAECMIGAPFVIVNQVALEAGKEMLNLIMGNVAGWLSTEGEIYNPLPPQVVADLSTVNDPGNTITFSLATPDSDEEDARIQLIIAYDDLFHEAILARNE